MPNITPFLSTSHLCFVLPEQCGAHAFLWNRRGKGGAEEDTLLQLYKTFLHPSEEKKIERELLLYVPEQACSGCFESLLTMCSGVDCPNISRQIPILILQQATLEPPLQQDLWFLPCSCMEAQLVFFYATASGVSKSQKICVTHQLCILNQNTFRIWSFNAKVAKVFNLQKVYRRYYSCILNYNNLIKGLNSYRKR